MSAIEKSVPGPDFPLATDDLAHVDRRGFLRLAACAAVAVGAAEVVGRSVASRPTVAEPPTLVTALDSLPPGEARAVRLARSRRGALVVRLGTGELVAYDRRCPHLGCPVLWSADRGRLECPCHAATFDAATGNVLSGPPPRGLERLAVEVAGPDAWLTRSVSK